MSIPEDQIGLDIELYGYGLDDEATLTLYTYLKAKNINMFFRNVLINDEAAAFVIARGNPALPAVYYGDALIGGLEQVKILLADIENMDGVVDETP